MRKKPDAEASEGLLRKLQMLEADYPNQPVMVQQVDLQEINRLRSQLGMPPFEAHPTESSVANTAEVTKPEPAEVQDHAEAREIYRSYLRKLEELAVHQAYADQVVQATAGHGRTPVRPLATMGTDGGPLLCDHCGKPIVLEGGRFNGVTADAAWTQNPLEDWTSWILGGMVVDIQTNGTLRIYHGYPGRKNDCCEVAFRKQMKARERFKADKSAEKEPLIRAFLEDEFPDMTREERMDLCCKILQTLYSYDPGIGVNRPTAAKPG